MIDLKYIGIEYGYITLNAIKNDIKCELIFDELLSDPIPQFVNFLNFVKAGKNIQEKIKEIDGRKIFDISATFRESGNVLFEMRCHEYGLAFFEIVAKKKVETIFEKILSDLLNDKDFPHMYPSHSQHVEEIYDKVDDEAWALYKENPELDADEIFKKYLREGRVPLEDNEKEVYEKYKIMLTEYKIPKGWI